ncbi:nickel pincer cofactor biosynthesis protein LarC [Oceanirhabdus seepicola]|uniref:Pyridinium-3,5-bisthiocarboxylic acid mononucleotide nickel insertion protein n=1 Tax=Oceanirhabdus seepicola TaxID=2828781 RepID=A0A9J6P6G8_9CLOT|nr:nickel pincer cofactor biosynthesis protein LarC [Oceanirhabdus seepicola]MCM1991389.1 nickel pincer cofactor biosynthesis protein LarC [Oceanirhabdus seepicola]
MEERVLYVDCLSGISGDMTIGMLLDLGLDKDKFIEDLNKLNISEYKINIEKGQKNGITGTNFNVILNESHTYNNEDEAEQIYEHQHTHNHEHCRGIKEIFKIIDESKLNKEVKTLSKKIFNEVAKAEATVHNEDIDKVHFHEVGAVDSIVDIVGTAILIDMLKVDKIISSPIHIGTGFVKCQHGKIPVPAPATLEILKGIPVYSKGIRSELVTPTGAAIVKVLVDEFKYVDNMIIDKIGYGLGDRDLEIANLLRGVILKRKLDESLIMLECNIDDMNPEIYSYLIPKALEKGAKDIFLTNIVMKKNRPGIKINLLCDEDKSEIFEKLLFEETTTLGLRKTKVDKVKLKSKFQKVSTIYGDVTIKICYNNSEIIKYAPEYEECRMLAEKNSVPIRKVFEEANYNFKKNINDGKVKK